MPKSRLPNNRMCSCSVSGTMQLSTSMNLSSFDDFSLLLSCFILSPSISFFFCSLHLPHPRDLIPYSSHYVAWSFNVRLDSSDFQFEIQISLVIRSRSYDRCFWNVETLLASLRSLWRCLQVSQLAVLQIQPSIWMFSLPSQVLWSQDKLQKTAISSRSNLSSGNTSFERFATKGLYSANHRLLATDTSFEFSANGELSESAFAVNNHEHVIVMGVQIKFAYREAT